MIEKNKSHTIRFAICSVARRSEEYKIDVTFSSAEKAIALIKLLPNFPEVNNIVDDNLQSFIVYDKYASNIDLIFKGKSIPYATRNIAITRNGFRFQLRAWSDDDVYLLLETDTIPYFVLKEFITELED